MRRQRTWLESAAKRGQGTGKDVWKGEGVGAQGRRVLKWRKEKGQGGGQGGGEG